MGGNRVVVHSGTETKQKREVALENIIKRLTIFKDVKKSEGYENFIICPETMGKFAEWEVAYHTSQLACLLENAKTISDFNEWRQSLYENGEFKLLAEFIDLAIERIELNNR